jgi:hypothetical protein
MPDLDALAATLQSFAEGRIPATTLTRQFREAVAHWPELPPRYRTVLEQLLGSLESSAMFSEESCSFSHADLAQSLAQWLQHARALAR